MLGRRKFRLGAKRRKLSEFENTFNFVVIVDDTSVRLNDVVESVKSVNKANLFSIP